MKRKTKNRIFALLAAILLQACAGVRYSYQSALDTSADSQQLRLEVGDSIELLAIGHGFPGYWGYYPWVISGAPEIATVVCTNARSLIPFREPGLIFGGKRCYLLAKKPGQLMLFFGNRSTVSPEKHQRSANVVVENKPL